MIRAVFVNHCHPEMPHICAVRVREFANAMARRGHQIILLTQSLDSEPGSHPASQLAGALSDHDFKRPFNLACAPKADPVLSKIRDPRTQRLIRSALIARQYLWKDGVFSDWRAGAAEYYPAVCERFRPDVIWASFGNTDCWNIGQDLARRAHCPWIADIKDNWSSFIPIGLRGLVARKYSDRKSWTALSRFNRDDGARWFGGGCHVVYSGTPNAWSAVTNTEPADRSTLSLTGGIYSPAALAELFAGIRRWAEGRPANQSSGVQLVYAGNDTDEVERQAPALGDKVTLSCAGYLDMDALYNLWTTSLANLYVRSERGFHHKTIELLAAGRPVLCLPRENTEARDLAAGWAVPLISCGTADDIAGALQRVEFDTEPPKVSPGAEFPYTWDKLCEELEAIFQTVIDQHRAPAEAR